MADILTKEVQFHDGEGITADDLNLLQRRIHAMINDGVLGPLARTYETQLPVPLTQTVYAIGNAGAVYGNGLSLDSQFAMGPIMVAPTGFSMDGDAPALLLYYISVGEISFTHAPATTNPRWDLVSVALSQEDNDIADEVAVDYEDAATRALTTELRVKVRKVAATVTVTQGAEAASPVEPALPAGHAKLAALRVAPSATSFDPYTDIRDYRVPLGFHDELVPGTSWSYSSSEYTRNALGHISCTVGAAIAYAHVPKIGSSRRIIQVGLGCSPANAFAVVKLMRMDLTQQTATALETLAIAGSAGIQYDVYNALSSLGYPLWSNGYMAGYAIEKQLGNPPTSVALAYSAGDVGDDVSLARWWLAG